METERTRGEVRVEVLGRAKDRRDQLIEDVRHGLTRSPKVLPPKYFYDGRGSELFEEITTLDEYYQTRSEAAILEQHATTFLEAVRPAELIEIGSGSSRKTQLLIEALRTVGGTTYAPLDVSVDALEEAAARLSERFPWLNFHGVVADFDHGFPQWDRIGRRLVAFLGSTIGNFEGEERRDFLRNVRGLLDEGDGFLLGVDLIKDKHVLELAYDDPKGVTERFNKNLLRVLNHELEGNFDEDDFRYIARYNEEDAKVEMFLEAKRDLTVKLSAIDLEVRFQEGERMQNEISCKFDRARIERDLQSAGFAIDQWHTDPDGLFALLLARPV